MHFLSPEPSSWRGSAHLWHEYLYEEALTRALVCDALSQPDDCLNLNDGT